MRERENPRNSLTSREPPKPSIILALKPPILSHFPRFNSGRERINETPGEFTDVLDKYLEKYPETKLNILTRKPAGVYQPLWREAAHCTRR